MLMRSIPTPRARIRSIIPHKPHERDASFQARGAQVYIEVKIGRQSGGRRFNKESPSAR
jgi:hypothetical protein